jgi:hypothetical protein
MKKVLLVPLDSRPCNLKFPAKIASSSGFEVATPPDEFLGGFREPGMPEKIIDWLEHSAGSSEALIVSSDMICYGGLVASRKALVPFEVAAKRLSSIAKIKDRHPDLKIYVQSVLMRLSITADSEENESLWKKLFDHSVKDGDGLPDGIPAEVLADYLSARKRNHLVNEACLALAASGAADLVVISKEDCAETGPHKKEEAALMSYVDRNSIAGRIKILNGADEIGACLLARHIQASRASSPKIAVRYSFGKGRGISLYEDVPLDKVVSDHLDLVGATKVDPLKDAEKVFFVHSFEDEQRDLVFSQQITRNSEERHHLKNFCSEIVMMGEIGKEAFVADAFYANGSDNDFMEKLCQVGDPKKLLSYAGWNTSANSVGSALSAALIPAGERFLFERFAEDLGYQSAVRKKLEDHLLDSGISKFDLGARAGEAEEFATKELKKWAEWFFSGIGVRKSPEIKIAFPWGRTFEADCDIIFS